LPSSPVETLSNDWMSKDVYELYSSRTVSYLIEKTCRNHFFV
jgi:hypothetical protein